jgi:hypothetical protein
LNIIYFQPATFQEPSPKPLLSIPSIFLPSPAAKPSNMTFTYNPLYQPGGTFVLFRFIFAKLERTKARLSFLVSRAS